MSFTSVSSPAYADAGNHTIRCTVGIAGRTGVHSYLAVSGDATSQVLFDDLVAGRFGAVAPYVATVVTAEIPELRAHAFAKLASLRSALRPYDLPGGLSVLCDATSATGIDLQGLLAWGTANGAATTNWVDNNGGVVTLTGAQCVALAEAVLAYGQSVYAVLALAMNGVANVTLTTTAAIDALNWPI